MKHAEVAERNGVSYDTVLRTVHSEVGKVYLDHLFEKLESGLIFAKFIRPLLQSRTAITPRRRRSGR